MLGRYNLTPANRKGGRSEVYEFSGEYYGTMSALMGAGISVVLEKPLESSMTAHAELRFGYDAKAAGTADIDTSMMCRMMVMKAGNYTGEMSANMQRVIEDIIHMDGNVDADLALNVDVLPAAELYADVKALWNSVQIKETVMRFEDIVIPPGGTVVIDSEFFTATMDGENIVDLYDGDWLELSHRLTALEARGISSGNLDVTVLYREMFL